MVYAEAYLGSFALSLFLALPTYGTVIHYWQLLNVQQAA